MIRPLRNNVLLRASEAPQSSIAGIIIASAISNQAEVIACGQDVKELQPGQVVRYDAASVVKIDSYMMCREADVLCVVE